MFVKLTKLFVVALAWTFSMSDHIAKVLTSLDATHWQKTAGVLGFTL
ncbi:MAG: hypothetical protein HRU19_21270 [Pseudobacteriovorax sp.]|nr:hypothetical protein [Pseudobacteriovorax sp.]